MGNSQNARNAEIFHLRNSLPLPQTPSDLPGNRFSFAGIHSLPHNDSPQLRKKAKLLRNNPSPRESALWQQIRSKQLQGVKFRRQHIALGYILDFYAPEYGIAVELDGTGHNAPRDQKRDQLFTAWKITTLRFPNAKPLEEIISTIRATIQTRQIELMDTATLNLAAQKTIDNVARTPGWYTTRRAELQRQKVLLLVQRSEQLSLDMPSSVKKVTETDPAALALKGMHVAEPIRRKA